MTDKGDEFEGMGGSYQIDPKTGKRVLLHRTGEKAVESTDQTTYAGAQEKEDQPNGDDECLN